MTTNEHLKLLIRREGKVVLGKYCINLWLLTAVLVATFLSIAFSNGSLIYLDNKMNDPFTNWININLKGKDARDLYKDLQDAELQQHYGFTDVQADQEAGLSIFCNQSDDYQYLEIRFFEHLQSDLIFKVLEKDNVIKDYSIAPEQINDNMLGFVITGDALQRLGYSLDSIPPYIDLHSCSDGIDTLISSGFVRSDQRREEGGHLYARVPIPVLAVVKRLPMNMDMIAGRFFWNEWYGNSDNPLNLAHPDYYEGLLYFVSEGYEDMFAEALRVSVPDSLLRYGRDVRDIVLEMEDENILNHLHTWKPGRIVKLDIGSFATPISTYEYVAQELQKSISPLEVQRLYDYNVGNGFESNFSDLSLSFARLDSIRAFEYYIKQQYDLQVEMSQVISKENFSSVSTMATILSWAMIVFSIACIIIFIVNTLQSYFQKVKRNLGTFKAFGISSAELTKVYVLILLTIVFIAICIAILITEIVQVVLPLVGVMKDGKYSYFSLFGDYNTVVAIGIVIFASVATVILVMGQLLKQTPGDLIYDRD